MKPIVLLSLALSACGVAPPKAWVEDRAECNKQTESIPNPKLGEADEAWMACVRDRSWRDCTADPCTANQKARPY